MSVSAELSPAWLFSSRQSLSSWHGENQRIGYHFSGISKTRNWWETFRPLRGFFSLRFEVQVWGLDYYRERIGLIGVWEKTEGVKVSHVSQVNMYWHCKKVRSLQDKGSIIQRTAQDLVETKVKVKAARFYVLPQIHKASTTHQEDQLWVPTNAPRSE